MHKVLSAIVGAIAVIVLESAGLAQSSPTTTEPLVLLAPKPLTPGAEVLTLWPAGSPMLQAGAGYGQAEVFNTPRNRPQHVNYVTNIHNPSIEVYLAKPEKANGLGIILAAGGGNKTLNVGPEGTDLVPWFNERGISVFIERYRITPYKSAVDAVHDTQRSFKVIRAHAKEWGVDPKRLGIMGFSAGGEQAAWVGMNYDRGKPDDADPIEHESSRPDFVALVYAGWVRMDFKVPKDAPPAFCTVAGVDDMFHSTQTIDFVSAWLAAKIPAELHVYGHGGHANAMLPRGGIPFGTWQYRFLDWAGDLGLMNAQGKHEAASELKSRPG